MAKRKSTANTSGQQTLFDYGESQSESGKNKVGAQLGHTVSEETRQKIRASLAGRKNRPCSEETKRKIGAANKGRQTALGRKLSEESRRKIGAVHKGNKYNLGRRHSAETRRKISEVAKSRGENHNFRIDGNGDKRRTERKSSMQQLEYRLWREAVFTRDNWTCQTCSKRGGKLQADHVQPWHTNPELRYDVGNGRTMCDDCHKKTPTYGGRMRRYKDTP